MDPGVFPRQSKKTLSDCRSNDGFGHFSVPDHRGAIQYFLEMGTVTFLTRGIRSDQG